MRSSFWPLFGDEAQDNPATSKYLTLMEDHGGKIALLGARAMSGWLLFAQAARACDDAGDLTRSCILDEAASVTEWDGGAPRPRQPRGEPAARVPDPPSGRRRRVRSSEPRDPRRSDNGYLCDREHHRARGRLLGRRLTRADGSERERGFARCSWC